MLQKIKKGCINLFILNYFFLYLTSALKLTFKSMDDFNASLPLDIIILVKVISITEILTLLWTRVIRGRTCIIN